MADHPRDDPVFMSELWSLVEHLVAVEGPERLRTDPGAIMQAVLAVAEEWCYEPGEVLQALLDEAE